MSKTYSHEEIPDLKKLCEEGTYVVFLGSESTWTVCIAGCSFDEMTRAVAEQKELIDVIYLLKIDQTLKFVVLKGTSQHYLTCTQYQVEELIESSKLTLSQWVVKMFKDKQVYYDRESKKYEIEIGCGQEYYHFELEEIEKELSKLPELQEVEIIYGDMVCAMGGGEGMLIRFKHDPPLPKIKPDYDFSSGRKHTKAELQMLGIVF